MSNDRLRTCSIGHAAQRPAKKTLGRSERERVGQHRDGGVSSTVLNEGESESERWANGGLCANRATGQHGLRAFRGRAAQLLQYGRSIKRCQAYALLWFRSICALLERDLVCTYRGYLQAADAYHSRIPRQDVDGNMWGKDSDHRSNQGNAEARNADSGLG
jgi:hypothetical protein